jgi:hypothetical protein
MTPVRQECADLQSFCPIYGKRKGNQQYCLVSLDFFLYEDLRKLVLKPVASHRSQKNTLQT